MLVSCFWKNTPPKKHPPESKRIISTAAKILITDIRSHIFECDRYPANECISDLDKNMEWLSPKRRLFMETLIRSPIKRASIGQFLANAIRPRSTFLSLLFVLAVEIDHVSGSKWQANELNRLGYRVSIDELRYKQSVVMNESAIDLLKRRNMRGTFQHWTACIVLMEKEHFMRWVFLFPQQEPGLCMIICQQFQEKN